MESFDSFIKQLVPLANKQHKDFVLSERKRRHQGYHGNHPSGVMLEQLKGRCQPLLCGEDGRPGRCGQCCHYHGSDVTAVSFDLRT